jgi:hypothetical protein
MRYADVPTFLADLQARQATAALALEFAVLTAARSGEVLGALTRSHIVPAKSWRRCKKLGMVTSSFPARSRADHCRSAFRDWAAECTNLTNEICEAALAHVVKNKAEAAYRRGDLFEKRRKLMEAWAAYCTAPKAGKVVALRR